MTARPHGRSTSTMTAAHCYDKSTNTMTARPHGRSTSTTSRKLHGNCTASQPVRPEHDFTANQSTRQVPQTLYMILTPSHASYRQGDDNGFVCGLPHHMHRIDRGTATALCVTASHTSYRSAEQRLYASGAWKLLVILMNREFGVISGDSFE